MNVPTALAKAVAKYAKRIDGKFAWGLPNYTSDSKYKLKLVKKFGDRSLFDDSDNDEEDVTGWFPLATLAGESQFLCVAKKAPFAVGMWEHEDGKIYPVWDSLEEFSHSVLAKKSDKTPIELAEQHVKKASALIDSGKHAAAVKLLAPIIATLPKYSDDYDDEQSGLWNVYGLALQNGPKALHAYERSFALGNSWAMLNVLGLHENAGDPNAVLRVAKDLERDDDPYVEVWTSRYVIAAYAALGKPKEAARELRRMIKRRRDDSATYVTDSHADLLEFLADNAKATKALAGVIDEYKPSV